MPDFAPNYTARYRMRYRVAEANHSVTIRVAASPNTTAQISANGAAILTDLLTAIAPLLASDFTVLGAEAAKQDSDVFLPATVLPVGSGDGPALDSSWTPMNISFVGRSATGGRAVFRIFGTTTDPMAAGSIENDYRILGAESTAVSNAVAALNLSTNTLANDGAEVTWYDYVNININSYWQKRRRRA